MMLYNKERNEIVPLKEIRVDAHVVDIAAQVSLSLSFHNVENVPIEAVFKFPLDPMSAVCHCSATINGYTVSAVVKEKNDAKNQYDDAISAGKGAYLLEKERDDIFTMNVGNLPPDTQVVIKIVYITELVTYGTSTLNFIIPETIFSISGNGQSTQGKFTEKVPYKLCVNLDIEMPSSISNVELINHKELNVHISGQKAKFESEDVEMGKDFVAIITTESHDPHIWIEDKPSDSNVDPFGVMVTLRPDVKKRENDSQVIFLIDRSGSMQGLAIQKARETLYTALKHLPEICTFNIYGFGSTHEKLFKESKKCNLKSKYEARQAIVKMDADLGGTNLFGPLNELFSTKDDKGKTIFVLSDGAVDNSAGVIQLVADNIQSKDRLYTFGIGDSVDKSLMKELAIKGKGESLFISLKDDSMEKTIISQVNSALQPAFEEVVLVWENTEKDKILQAPVKLPPIFNSQIYSVFALVKDPLWNFTSLTLKAKGIAGEYSYKFELNHVSRKTGLDIHRLAARTLIRELEEGGSNTVTDKEILRLAKLYNLASSLTSFLAIDNRHDSVMETMQLRTIPLPSNNIPTCITGAISWRSEGIKYKTNEFLVRVTEESSTLVSATGSIINSTVKGSVMVLSHLSGVPEVKVGIDFKSPVQEIGLKFHQCVRLSRFETDSVISCIPPDGNFEMISYHDTADVKPPITVDATIETYPGYKIDYHIRLKTDYASSSTSDIEVLIPVPEDGCSPTFTVSPKRGKVEFIPEKNQLCWKIPNLSGETSILLTASFKLSSVISEKPFKMPPIFVNYELHHHSATRMQLKYIKIIEKSNYKVTQEVSYFVKGNLEIRTKEIVIRRKYPL